MPCEAPRVSRLLPRPCPPGATAKDSSGVAGLGGLLVGFRPSPVRGPVAGLGAPVNVEFCDRILAKATTGDSRWLVLEAERSKARPLSNYGDNAPYSSLDLACRLAFGREFFEVHEGKHSVRTMLAGLMQRFKLVDKQSEIGDLARAIAFLEAYWEETRSEALQAWEQIRSSQARMNQETAQRVEAVFGER